MISLRFYNILSRSSKQFFYIFIDFDCIIKKNVSSFNVVMLNTHLQNICIRIK